ncbi:hypothetical protein FOJ82_05310 [Tessaracoccus rhinocerotis]|uniref:Uncharacterized protein n=1 Tax=Tessaracoccus rhinocerotis TaxID=1689449 RepID=A0A553K1G2_9ACTN|nr:hypothetical protein [Tessaracoccus rhinocerotis]TRY18548.1 hypothetical protein FOJ82_05310 [Tessaracoccus rhinocerotis]
MITSLTLWLRSLGRETTPPQPDDPGMAVKMSPSGIRDLDKLVAGEPIDEAPVHTICDFVDIRFDCADFRVLTLLRIAYSDNPNVSDDLRKRIRTSLLGFRYWMDEQGEDSMCFWSENHQVIFAACEYLAGRLYPDEEFTNPGPDGRRLTGREREARGRRRLETWFDHRFRYGFTEWNSNTYYEEDVAPLALLVDLSGEQEMVRRATTMLDLLLLDMALHRFERYFISSAGRAYEAQKKDPRRADVNDIVDHAFGRDFRPTLDKAGGFFVVSSYETPEVLRRIAAAPGELLLKESFGLDVDEVVGEVGPARDVETTGLFFWLMEAFTTPESIRITVDMVERWRMHTNRFLEPLGAFRRLPRALLPGLVRLLNPATQGVAIQRADVQTFRTPHHLLTSAQGYQPGGFGDQQHLWQAILPGGVPVFAVHPGAPMFDETARNFSPASWVGNGINPQVGQDRGLLIALHDLRLRGGFLERERLRFTHLFWPTERFDEHTMGLHPGGGNWLAARCGEGFIGVVSMRPLQLGAEPEPQSVVQSGDVTGWVVLMGSADEGSFAAFCERVRTMPVTHTVGRRPREGSITATLDGVAHELRWDGGLHRDGVRLATDYPRLDTPFVRAERFPTRLHVSHDGHTLDLDWGAGTRVVGADADATQEVAS